MSPTGSLCSPSPEYAEVLLKELRTNSTSAGVMTRSALLSKKRGGERLLGRQARFRRVRVDVVDGFQHVQRSDEAVVVDVVRH